MLIFVSLSCSTGEIIETYWNVKEADSETANEQNHEIIETYWNVKLIARPQMFSLPHGNNRNILECKVMLLVRICR